MSSRIIPLTALSVMLLVIFWAVVATAQAPIPQEQLGGTQPLPQETQPQPVQPQQPQQPAGQFLTPEQQYQLQQQQLQQQQLQQQQAQQPQYQQQPQPQQLQPVPPPQPLATAPFTLSPQEEAVLDRLLGDWQLKSGEVKTFEATFTRWDYDPIFGDATKPKRVVKGDLKYQAPDKGYYALEDESEKWICTGTAVFEFKKELKQMREYPLPKGMQGTAIADGPMPFVFGVQAAKMKARYWMRIITPPANQATQVWLEVYPRQAKDAANFQKIEVILSFAHDGQNVTKLEPYALNMHLPNSGSRTVYQFADMKVNGILATVQGGLGWFVRPTTPFGWQHIVEQTGEEGPGSPPAGGAPQAGAPQGPAANSATNVQPGIDVGSALPTGAVR
jgi:TIGR03009 family protein